MNKKSELPHSFEAEQSVLGAMMLDNQAISRLQGLVDASDFCMDTHRRIFNNIMELHKRSVPIDLVILTNELKGSGELESIGGAVYLAELLDATVSSANVIHHVNIIKEKSFARRLIKMASRVQEQAVEGEVSEVLQEVKNFERVVLLREFIGNDPKPLSVDEGVKIIRESPEGLRTGYTGLDEFIRIAPSELIIIGARPRHGKSSWAYNLLLNMCNLYPEQLFVFFSYEVNFAQLFTRLISILSAKSFGGNYSFWDVRNQYRIGAEGQLCKQVFDAQEKLRKYAGSIFLVNEPGFTIEQIVSYSKRMLDKHKKIGAIFIDYMELVQTETKQDTEELRIGYISTILRRASQELNTPIIVLAQMNRETVKGKKRKRPTLEGLRYSGKQEAEATTVLGLYNPEVEKIEDRGENTGIGTTTETTVEVILLKSRWAEPNKIVKLDFDMRTGFINNKEIEEW